MRIRQTLTYFVFASCVVAWVLASVAKNHAAETRSGDWTISKSDDPGKTEQAAR